MANETYTSKLNPQFQNAGVQDVTADLSGVRSGLDFIIKQNENELQALKNIAEDQSQIEFNRGAADLIKQYDTDYEGLNKALLKLEYNLYNRAKPTQPVMAENLLRQNDQARLRAVGSARNRYVSKNNERLKRGSGKMLESYRLALPDDYATYLYNLTLPAEQKDNEIITRWTNNVEQIDKILNRKDMEGNYIFDEKTRKSRASLQDYMVDGGKTLIDRYMSNNDEAGLKKYYESHILAPERYMKETGMDRATYDKVRGYAEKGLKQLGVEAKNLKFNQTIAEYEGLQREFFPGKLDELKEQGLPNKLVKSLEKTNVTFSMIDPAKTESPTAMIDSILAVNDFDADYAEGFDAKTQTVYNGTEALSKIGEYGQKHGLSDKTIRQAQEMVINKENEQLFGDIYANFSNMIENFNPKLKNVRKGPATFGAITHWDGMTIAERNKLTDLNKILTNSQIALNDAKYSNPQAIPAILYDTQKRVARLKYTSMKPGDGLLTAGDWAKIDADPEAVVILKGKPVKIKGYTENGELEVQIQK